VEVTEDGVCEAAGRGRVKGLVQRWLLCTVLARFAVNAKR